MNSLKHKAQIARKLSTQDWLTLIEAWLALMFFRAALRRLSYQRLTATAQPDQERDAEPSRAHESAQRLQRLLHFAARLHFPAMTCLPQALALCWMLSRRGIPAQIQIGVRKNSHDLYAHAWVEVLGKTFGESDGIRETFNVLAPATDFSIG